MAKRATARVQTEQPGPAVFWWPGPWVPLIDGFDVADVNNPAFRAVTFDDLAQAYYDQGSRFSRGWGRSSNGRNHF